MKLVNLCFISSECLMHFLCFKIESVFQFNSKTLNKCPLNTANNIPGPQRIHNDSILTLNTKDLNIILK